MKALWLLLHLVTIPSAALGQGSIAGRVTDSAGTPVPGLTVEAPSLPCLAPGLSGHRSRMVAWRVS